MKKVLIVAVCLALVLTLVFTLGALGKKPDKPPGKPEHFIYELTFTGDVFTNKKTGTVEQCGAQGGFISSSSEDGYRPTLTLDSDKFGKYGGKHDGQYLDLSEHKGEITMQFFFLFEDPGTKKKEKVQLNVYGDGEKGELDGDWLSSSFTIKFVGDPAEILPTKGKRIPRWDGPVNITIRCQGK